MVLSLCVGIVVGAAVTAAVVADVEAIFTWFTEGNSVDNRLDNGFCGIFDNGFGTELLDNVFIISDDV